MWLLRSLSLAGLLTTAACRSNGASGDALACSDRVPSFTESDSSGITIAISGAARDSISLIDRTPDAVFGSELDMAIEPTGGGRQITQPMYFGDITDARTLPDGSVLVVDGQAVAARLFSQEGEYLREIGRRGGGPGEFQRVHNVFVGAGDTVWLFDGNGRKLLGFDADYESVASVSLPRLEVVKASRVAGSAPQRIGIRLVPRAPLSDGRWLLAGMASAMDHEEVSSVSRDSTQLYVWQSRTDVREPRQLLLGTQRYELFTSDGSITFGDVALGYSESFAAASDRYFIGDGYAFNIEERLPDGTLARMIRVCAPPAVISARLADSLDDVADASDPSSPLLHEAEARRLVPRPRPAPAYHELRHDQSDRLWVREFSLPGAPQVWSVFDADGERILRVSLPSNQKVLDASRDWVLVRNESELGEATLHRYSLQ